MLIVVTTPNSFNKSLFVMINVAKPTAVVILVIKVAVPVLVITRCNALALLECLWYS